MAPDRIVIAGTGQAGLQAAVSLREAGHSGSIILAGDEPGLPYQRPPLSKAFLLGKIPASGLDLRGADFLAAQGIGIVEGDPVLSIDRERRDVRLASGRTLAYDHLVLATGARPRELVVPGSELPGIHYLRTRADALALKARLEGAKRALVIGTGEPYAVLPWFWSDQGAIRLQIAGLAGGHDRTVVRGDPASGRFSVFCYRGDRLVGVESINRPADHLAARRFVGTSLAPGAERVADEGLDLKMLTAVA